MRQALLLTVVFASLTVIGCSATPQSSPAPKRITAQEYPRMFQASIDVLRDAGFIVDREDYRFGKVSSKPQIAGTIAEPWKPSSAGARGALESTSNQQRRVVQVSLEPLGAEGADTVDVESSGVGSTLNAVAAEQGGDYQLRVEVIVERLQVPARYLSGATSGTGMFSQYTAVPAEWQRRGIPGAYWRPVGRDPLLEQRLIEQIVRHSVDVTPPARESAG